MKKFYDVVLLIRHPDIDPETISKTLKLEAYCSWKAGEERRALNGSLLGGIRQDSRWNHIFIFDDGEDLSEELDLMLDWLSPHRDFFERIVSEGGSISLFVNLPGRVNHGEMFEPSVLQKIVDMKMSFGFEVFPDWIQEE